MELYIMEVQYLNSRTITLHFDSKHKALSNAVYDWLGSDDVISVTLTVAKTKDFK